VEKEMVRQDLTSRFLPRIAALVLAVLLVVPSVMTAAITKEAPGVRAARRVLERVIGPRAASFDLTLRSGDNAADSCILEASGGRVRITGTSPVAIVRGAYEYLRSSCNCMVTWSGAQVDLPTRFPDRARFVVASPYPLRQYFNACTFGYSTVWWDWQRWEREIDWMALHGINMPMALVGHMGVWQRVWGSFGIPRDSLRAFFSGPAFLPWHWMGNINGHGGPLPQSWIDAQEALQKRILARMKDLGMLPIVPAFSGFVPPAFHRAFPTEAVFENVNWSGLSAEVKTFALTPGTPMFKQIGERFIKEYRRTFGPCRYYLADTFNELDVPVSSSRRYDELAGYGAAVYETIKRGDPDGVWVMQGWLFNDRTAFWDSASTGALLSRVPEDKMIILDLANEEFQGWKLHRGFYGKQWIYSMIHNFGGNNSMRGRIGFVASDPPSALLSPVKGALVGYGLSPEGLDNNEIMYELGTDMAWTREPLGVQQWVSGYARSRYGKPSANAERAWQLLREAVYDRSVGHHMLFAFQYRPSLVPHSDASVDPRIDQALDLLLAEAGILKGSALYRNDLVDLAIYVMGNRIDARLSDACRAHLSGDVVLRDTLAVEADVLLKRLDAVINTRADMRLEQWIGTARAAAHRPEEKAQFEQNARRQITVWGGPDLHEYAAKIWSGMVRDFYSPRWQEFFSLLRQNADADLIQARLREWDEQWWQRSDLGRPDPVADLPAAITTLIGTERAMIQVTREPILRTTAPVFVTGDSTVVTIAGDPGIDIHYTLDGSAPVLSNPRYVAPLVLRASTVVRTRAFVPGWWQSTIATQAVVQVGRNNGLRSLYYPEPISDLTDSAWALLKGGKPGRVFDVTPRPDPGRIQNYAVAYAGYLLIDTSGEYTLGIESDDGSSLLLDGRCIVDNGGYHGAREKTATLTLEKGYHPIEARYFQSRGGASLILRYQGPGVTRQRIPMQKLFVEPESR
jgi:alpha-N-acetylglucosaminidase